MMNLNFVQNRNVLDGLGLATALALFSLLTLSLALYLKHSQALTSRRMANRAFVAQLGPLLIEWRLDAIIDLAKKHVSSPLAQLMSEISSTYVDGIRKGDEVDPVQYARLRALHRLSETRVEQHRSMRGLQGTIIGAVVIACICTVIAVFGDRTALVWSEPFSVLLIASGLGVALVAAILNKVLSDLVILAEHALAFSVDDFLEELEQSSVAVSVSPKCEQFVPYSAAMLGYL